MRLKAPQFSESGLEVAQPDPGLALEASRQETSPALTQSPPPQALQDQAHSQLAPRLQGHYSADDTARIGYAAAQVAHRERHNGQPEGFYVSKQMGNHEEARLAIKYPYHITELRIADLLQQVRVSLTAPGTTTSTVAIAQEGIQAGVRVNDALAQERQSMVSLMSTVLDAKPETQQTSLVSRDALSGPGMADAIDLPPMQPGPQQSFAQDMAARKAASNPMGLLTNTSNDTGYTTGRITGSVYATLGGDKQLMGEFQRLNQGVDVNNVRSDRDYKIPTSVADADVANAHFQTVAKGWKAQAYAKNVAEVSAAQRQYLDRNDEQLRGWVNGEIMVAKDKARWALMSTAEKIPGGSPMTVAPNKVANIGVTGYMLDKLDDFQRSDLGHALQGLPPESLAIGGIRAGLVWLNKVDDVGRTGAVKFVPGGETLTTEMVELSAQSSLWQSRMPGVQVRQIGDWWVKRVDPDTNKFMQFWGGSTINAQYKGLQKLGDMATESEIHNGVLFTRDVGQKLPDGFRLLNNTSRNAYIEGSIRMGTFFNDIQPRNMGVNGLIFDPAVDNVTKTIFAAGATTMTLGGAYVGSKIADKK